MFEQKLYLSSEYHNASKNTNAYMHVLNEHQIHYREDILKIKNKVSFAFQGNRVPLPAPLNLRMNLTTALEKRESSREYENRPMSAETLATILHYSAGYKRDNKQKKHAPSSGGFNSVEVFVFVLNSDSVPQGIYHYDSFSHELEEVRSGDYKEWLRKHVFFQDEFAGASVVFVLTSMVGKLIQKYGLRSYRLALLDTGHISQNIYLTATALDLNVCASAGFIDTEIDEALMIDGEENASFLTIMVN